MKALVVLLLIIAVIFGLGTYLTGSITGFLSVIGVNKVISSLPLGSPNQDTNNSGAEMASQPFELEVVAENLRVPWSLVFTAEDRLLIAERTGTVRVSLAGVLQDEALFTFEEVESSGEEGLMGLTLDPDYSNNKQLYACLAYPDGDNLKLKVEQLRDDGSELVRMATVLDSIPASRFHAGCRIKFGVDDKLYLTTGDAGSKDLAQDINSLAGKILRINSDGTVPSDNPFPGSPVYSLGHRNPQGIDWHPITGALYSTEHGPSGFDGPGGGDEINLIEAGKNYGWPVVSHNRSKAGLIDPLTTYTPAIAPASGTFYSGAVFPQFKNSFLIGALRGEGVYMVTFSAEDPKSIQRNLKLPEVDFGRIRDIVQGPDDLIYFTTSNQDGRGKPKAGDDKVYRFVPVQ